MRVDRTFCCQALLLALLSPSLPGCPSDQGELRSLIEDADERRAATLTSRDEAAPAEAAAPQRYPGRGGLHIDMPYLAGRPLSQLDPDAAADQLGVEISREAVSIDELHIVYDKAEIWVFDGTIYRVRQALAHPMDTPTAFGVSGFPLALGQPLEGARVARWNRVWGMRRIELERSEEDKRLFTHIDVWRFLPRERR